MKKEICLLALLMMLCACVNVHAEKDLLGMYYQNRSSDRETALEYLREAALGGDAYAMYELGMENVEEERHYWLEYAAMGGVTEAMVALYREYRHNSPDTALLFLEDAAQAGNAEAMFELATVYMWGDLEQRANDEKARYWLDKAVEERWEQAWYYIAYAYEHGLYGYPKNEKQAVGWYMMLWDLGEGVYFDGVEMWEYGEGVFNLACMIEAGRGREKDDELAFRLYEEAHDHLWDCKALLKMAAMYAQGRGTTRNTQKAWDILDSLREDAPGYEGDWAYLMGMMYEKGYGVQKNQTLAKAYYEQAQEYGCMLEW